MTKKSNDEMETKTLTVEQNKASYDAFHRDADELYSQGYRALSVTCDWDDKTKTAPIHFHFVKKEVESDDSRSVL